MTAGTPRAAAGPVLNASPASDGIIVAIHAQNQDVQVVDRGGYRRVLVPGRCRVSRAAIEEAIGAPFRMPVDLERVMPSFTGRFHATEDEAVWEGEP